MKIFKKIYPQTDLRYKFIYNQLHIKGIDYITNFLSWETKDIVIIAFGEMNDDVQFLKYLNFKKVCSSSQL